MEPSADDRRSNPRAHSSRLRLIFMSALIAVGSSFFSPHLELPLAAAPDARPAVVLTEQTPEPGDVARVPVPVAAPYQHGAVHRS